MTKETRPDSVDAAGGWEALAATGRIVREQGAPLTSVRALLKANQPNGFDCPGCAWPDPKHTSSFEFCENGAKAVAWETTSRVVDAEFFAKHTVSGLRARSDYWLESQGRLACPLRYDASVDRYVPVSWDEAMALIGSHLRGLPTPHAAAFYTSGRTSNEAAFLYQLFAREFGTNNLPDCSNLCHEATSVGLPMSIGVGKGTVQLQDFEQTDLILSFGHNPGTNHPRMLGTLRDAARRGVPIVVFNPLKERGLEKFRSPQHATEMLTGGGTVLATHYFQPRIGSDPYVLQGIMKRLCELHESPGDPLWGAVLDEGFLATHTTGFDTVRQQVSELDWDVITRESALAREDFDVVARLYARAPSAIIAYGMGITQHAHGTENVQQIANLLLMRGNIGRPGAGVCPVRGHSNVQGDRTMGINERPPAWLLDRLDQVFGIRSPREHGCNVVECIERILRGEIQVLISLGGNFAVAAPDPVQTHRAMSKLSLHVGIHTKLNRSHLLTTQDALILPALGRSDLDAQPGGIQSVSVEDSMSMVHASHGFKKPPSEQVRSEPWIVAGIAAAAVPASRIDWRELAMDYGRIRDCVERVIPGFTDFNKRLAVPGGFHLPNAAAGRTWQTGSGRAEFKTVTLYPRSTSLQLTTIRSHDQYNTTIYGLDDRYRGIKGRRDVLFVNEEDMRNRGLSSGDVVEVRSGERVLSGLSVVPYPIAAGCCAAYYPEANVLIGLEAFDRQSGTPAYKSVAIELRKLA